MVRFITFLANVVYPTSAIWWDVTFVGEVLNIFHETLSRVRTLRHSYMHQKLSTTKDRRCKRTDSYCVSSFTIKFLDVCRQVGDFHARSNARNLRLTTRKVRGTLAVRTNVNKCLWCLRCKKTLSGCHDLTAMPTGVRFRRDACQILPTHKCL